MLEAVLLHSPVYKEQRELELYVPGELARQPLGFASPVVLYASRSNPGAAALAAELCNHFQTDLLSYTEDSPAKVMVMVQPRSAVIATRAAATHFLLYLSKDTFAGDPGQQLAVELREALTNNHLPIVMAHENDMAKGGCPFARCNIQAPYATSATLLWSVCFALSSLVL